jgi:hypothetical protein
MRGDLVTGVGDPAAINASIRSTLRSTRSSRSLQLSRETTGFRFSTWNQSSTSIDITARVAERGKASIGRA